MALSAYVFHTFLVQDGWHWAGAGRSDQDTGAALDPSREAPALLGIWFVLLAAAWLIRRRFGQGPLEWLLHWLTGARPAATA
jgi:uncharacterized membrane protein YeiB